MRSRVIRAKFWTVSEWVTEWVGSDVPPDMVADFGMKCLLWRHLATLITMQSGSFSAFLYTMSQWKKTAKFQLCTYSSQIWCAVHNGESSNLPGHCAVLELRGHATEVWLNQSSWIFHTIFCCQFPLCSLGNTLPHPQNLLGANNSNFLILPFLATSHWNLALMSCTCFLFEIGITPPLVDSEHAECWIGHFFSAVSFNLLGPQK